MSEDIADLFPENNSALIFLQFWQKQIQNYFLSVCMSKQKLFAKYFIFILNLNLDFQATVKLHCFTNIYFLVIKIMANN